MRNTLYVSNLSENVTEEQLTELFGEYGKIENIEFGMNEKFKMRFALVTMDAEKRATKAMHRLNGHVIDDRYLTISYPDLDLSKPILTKQAKFIEEVCEALGEEKPVPLRQIEMMVRLCGTSFVEVLVREAMQIEDNGGMVRQDNQEKRTLGGVFFYIARPRVSEPVHRMIYHRKGKPYAESDDEGEEVGTSEDEVQQESS